MLHATYLLCFVFSCYGRMINSDGFMLYVYPYLPVCFIVKISVWLPWCISPILECAKIQGTITKCEPYAHLLRSTLMIRKELYYYLSHVVDLNIWLAFHDRNVNQTEIYLFSELLWIFSGTYCMLLSPNMRKGFFTRNFATNEYDFIGPMRVSIEIHRKLTK